MKLTLCLIVAAYLAVDLWVWHGPLDHAVTAWLDRQHSVVARIQGQIITQADVDRAVQDDCFRRGVDAQGADPKAVLDRLIEGAMIRAARLSDPTEPHAAHVDEELRLFIKQFPLDTDYPERLPLQNLTEAQLRHQMQAALDDQAWLEKQLKPQVNEASAQAWYATHKAELEVPESFHAAHLFLGDHEKDPKDDPNREPEIRALYQQLTAGTAKLEELAAKTSDDERTKKYGGDLGWFTRSRMPADFMATVTALKPGEMSPPVHTHLGWHVIKLIEKKPARVPEFEEVKAEILASLRNQERATALAEFLAGLRAKFVTK